MDDNMNPEEMKILKARFDNLNDKVSTQIYDFVPENINDNNKLYTSYIISIFLTWLDNYVEDIKFK
jgi:hypothetical protein